jgi:hypothetical protein
MYEFAEPRMVYIFRPNQEITHEPEYVLLESKLPSGTYVFDPLDLDDPWTIWTGRGQNSVTIKALPDVFRAWQLILETT